MPFMASDAHSPFANGLSAYRRDAAASTMTSANHLFCPQSGSLLEVNADTGVVQCKSSGYTRNLVGARLARLQRVFAELFRWFLYAEACRELCTSATSTFRSCADLADVVVRKELDMEDFFRRHDLQPLVQAEKLDAGKRVLQRVRRSALRMRLLALVAMQRLRVCIFSYQRHFLCGVVDRLPAARA